MDRETTFFDFRDTLSQVRARVPHLGADPPPTPSNSPPPPITPAAQLKKQKKS